MVGVLGFSIDEKYSNTNAHGRAQASKSDWLLMPVCDEVLGVGHVEELTITYKRPFGLYAHVRPRLSAQKIMFVTIRVDKKS